MRVVRIATCPKCKWGTNTENGTTLKDSFISKSLTCPKDGEPLKLSKQWYVIGQHEGRPIKHKCGPLKKQATDWLAECIRSINNGEGVPGTQEVVEPTIIPVVRWEDGVKAYQKSDLKASTKKNLPYALSALTSEFAGRDMATITALEVAEFLEERQEAGISACVRAKELGYIRRMFTLVTKTREEDDYPELHKAQRKLDKLDKAQVTNRKDDFWNKDEINKLAESASPTLALTIRIQAETGMRPGNVYRLRKDYFSGRQITIPADEMKAGRVFVTTVSAELMRDINAYLLKTGNRDWLFPAKVKEGEESKPVHDFRKQWAAAIEASGLKGTPHKLRHSFASIQLANGVPLIEVSRLLAHANISITADIYGHLERKHLDSRLDEHHAFMAN